MSFTVKHQDIFGIAAAFVAFACVVVLIYAIDTDSPIRGPAYIAGSTLMALAIFQIGQRAISIHYSGLVDVVPSAAAASPTFSA